MRLTKIADISLLNSCNFSCDYCISKSIHTRKNNDIGMWDINSPVLDYYPLLQFIKNNLSDYIIQISGGEPLTMSGIEYLLNEAVNINQVVVNTNGSLLPLKYNRISDKVFYRISMHPEQRDLDTFKEQLKNIDSNRCMINYMVHPRHIRNGKFFEYKQWLDESKYHYEITPFRGNYNNEFYMLLNDVYKDVITPAVTMEYQEIIVIKPNGLVFPCHGHLDDNKSIGDIYTGRFDKSVICNHRCRTPTDKSMCMTYDPIIRILDIIKG